MAFVDGLPSVLLKNVAQSIQDKVPAETSAIGGAICSLVIWQYLDSGPSTSQR